MQKIALLLIFWRVCLCLGSNLITDGDFQVYSASQTAFDIFYEGHFSDASRWFQKNMGWIEIKKYISAATTNGAELSVNNPIQLCHNLSLLSGAKYSLSYDLYCPGSINNMNLTVNLNGNLVSDLFISLGNSFGSQMTTFIAQTVNNQLCFSETHGPANYDPGTGGLLDNVSLVMISIPINKTSNTTNNISTMINGSSINNNTINTSNEEINNHFQDIQIIQVHVEFELKLVEMEGRIILLSNLSDLQPYFELLQTHSLFLLGSQILNQTQFAVNQGFLKIDIILNHSQDMNSIEVRINDTEQEGKIYKFTTLVKNKDVFFNELSETSQTVVKYLKPYIITINSIIKDIYLFSSSSFCSYFIISLFSFANLAIMYYFLLIKSTPIFVRQIYQIVVRLLCEESSLIKWICETFELKESTFNVNFEESLKENVKVYQNGFRWFGDFGFSSKIFANNMDAFMILSFLLFKILLIKLIYQLLKGRIQISWKLRANLALIFLIQIFALVPFIQPSALSSLLNASTVNFLEKIYQSTNLILLFSCLFVFSLIVVYRKSEISKKLERKKIEQESKITRLLQLKYQEMSSLPQKRRNESVIRFQKLLKEQIQSKEAKFKKQQTANWKLESCQLVLNITIPFFVYLQIETAFFAINFCVFFIKAYNTIQHFKDIDFKDKIYRVSMVIVWIVHHICFLLMYLLDKEISLFDEAASSIRIVCGVILLSTVSVGCTLELTKVGIQILILGSQIIRKIKHCYQRSKIQSMNTTDHQNQNTYANILQPKNQRHRKFCVTNKKSEKQKINLWTVKIQEIQAEYK